MERLEDRLRRCASGQREAAATLPWCYWQSGTWSSTPRTGQGTVAARERRVVLGKPREVIVLALAGGLSVELPIERAHELLRPLASEADMSLVQKTLGADHAANRDTWLKRRRDSQAKLTGGDPIELAEIIRDSAHREGTLRAKSQLSPGERELFVKARQLLSTEIALARGVELAEANAWIDKQLARTG